MQENMSILPYNVSLLEPGEGRSVNVTYKNNKITFEYPCSSQFECTPYIVSLPRGKYKFELYGTSSGTQVPRNGLYPEDSVQAGGIVSGVILVPK